MDMQHQLLKRTIRIDPPLLNSANPWATSREDLEALYRSPYTGAVTTRTCLLQGFPHDDTVHQYTFFDPATQAVRGAGRSGTAAGSLNTLGYSPRTLDDYLDDIHDLYAGHRLESGHDEALKSYKPFIVSVTGSPEEVRRCWDRLNERQASPMWHTPLLMEVNLSCPNIAGKPPPAYSAASLKEYLTRLDGVGVPIGLKVPPYTYHDQFHALISALKECAGVCRVSFITAVNTLGSSLVLQGHASGEGLEHVPAIDSSTGSGIGGMAGAPLHPLALGNVKILSELLKADPILSHVQIIGVGGVSDAEGFKRMRAVGASAVAVGTALGEQGPTVFERIVLAPPV